MRDYFLIAHTMGIDAAITQLEIDVYKSVPKNISTRNMAKRLRLRPSSLRYRLTKTGVIRERQSNDIKTIGITNS